MKLRIENTWNGQPAPREMVELSLRRSEGSLLLEVDSPFYADPPPSVPPGSCWGLWDHEVVELFIVGPGEKPQYTEIELGPHGHWLVLRLNGVRQVVERELPLAFQARISSDRWTGRCTIPSEWIPEGPHRINAFAIHGVGEARRYLSMTPLPGSAPDFHQPDQFTELELP